MLLMTDIITLSIAGRSVDARWRDWSSAHSRKMVPWLSGLLSELAQHHAHSRGYGGLLDASGKAHMFTFVAHKLLGL